MPEDVPSTALHSIGDYYSAAQLRADRWSAVRDAVSRLAELGPEHRWRRCPAP